MGGRKWIVSTENLANRWTNKVLLYSEFSMKVLITIFLIFQKKSLLEKKPLHQKVPRPPGA